jgi:hypothetical protein
VVKPGWYWGTAVESGGSEPLLHTHAPTVVESLPGGCLLYRLEAQWSLPQGRKQRVPRPDHEVRTGHKRLHQNVGRLKLV